MHKDKVRDRILTLATVDLDTGCWVINSGLTNQGYARIMVDYELDLGHRWSYRVFHGPIPVDKLVRHNCDNPPCANPQHLLLGTQSDNILDAVARGRYHVNRGGAKLDWDKVDEIRARTNERVKDLAAEYKVDRQTISLIRRNKIWLREVG